MGKDEILNIKHGNKFWLSLHLRDFILFWRFWGVNFKVEFVKKCEFWFTWFTPKWHNNRGPYLTTKIGFLRIMRGY
jgi:hypothetical protein